eukprot:SAG11_NODE_21221_length_429_cov_1.245455_1_plen_25_part_10
METPSDIEMQWHTVARYMLHIEIII